jgi:hypothetical protein
MLDELIGNDCSIFSVELDAIVEISELLLRKFGFVTILVKKKARKEVLATDL